MCYLWNILGIISFALAEHTIADPFFNQYVISYPYSDYSSFNPGAVFPSTIVHQQPDQLVSSFNPPQLLKAWPVLPKGFKSNQATGVVDSNPHPSLPVALVQQQTFPQVGFFSAPQETSPDLPQKIKTPYHNQACEKSKSHFSDAVRAFARNFVQKIQLSPKYTDAFSLHNASPETYVQAFYDYVYFLNKKKGDVDPEFAAYSPSQAVKNNYESTSTELFIEVLGYSVGQLLYETRHLTTENALKLSNEYFRATADSIDGLKVNTLKLLGAMDGVTNILSAYGVFSPALAFTLPAVFCQVYYTLNENCS